MIGKAKIIIVDEDDNIIGLKERGTLNSEDIYRVSALWIINSKNEVLLAQRAFTKKNHPGLWGPAVAGTNDKGETYESNIIKEAEEEIGIKNISPLEIRKVKANSKYNHFTTWFLLKIDKEISEFKKQDEEVEALKWIPIEELRKAFKNSPEKYLKSMNEDFLLNL